MPLIEKLQSTPVSSLIDKLRGLIPQEPIARPGSQLERVLSSSRAMGEQITEKVGQPLTRAIPLSKRLGELLMSPGTELLTPRLKKAGVSPFVSGVVGLGVDILAPGGGEAKTGGKLLRESKDLLAKEARKYKSAEEFVNNKEVYFRGTTAPQIGEIKPADTYGLAYGKGVYLASDARFAKDYGPNVSKYYVDWKKPFVMNKPVPNEIIDRLNKDFPAKKIVGGKLKYGTNGEDVLSQLPINENEINDYLQKLGFDGLKDASSGYNKQSVVFNTSILKTKSQLTDLWEKATKSFKLPRQK